MKFGWDTVKLATNLRKHPVSFEMAARTFEDELSATFPQPDHSYGEMRLVTYALAHDGRLLVISRTEKSGTIEIFSARVATGSDRKRYET